MLALLAPLGLIALAALALPVLIHLIRRSERRETDFAALRWLGERNRPRKQLHLHDRVLLALRLLLIAAIALLLALPVMYRQGEAGAGWVLVEPTVDLSAARAAVNAPTAEWHWLAPGFPPIETAFETPTLNADMPFASLIREADALLPPRTALTVVVPQTLSGLDPERLRLGHAVDWRPLPGRSLPPVVDTPLPALQVAIRGSGAHDTERVVIRALVKAWQADGREVLLDESGGAISADTSLLFWLGGALDDATRRWIAGGGRVIVSSISEPQGMVAMTDADGQPLLHDIAEGSGHLFAFNAALTPQALPALLDPEFPRKLLMQIEPPRAASSTAVASAVTPQKLDPAPPGPATSLDRWIALFAAAVFVFERLWATRRRSAAA